MLQVAGLLASEQAAVSKLGFAQMVPPKGCFWH